jgi:pyruvate-formate lyase-activating enzyme
MNSVRPACYETYFRPADYGFADVLESISRALSREVFVSINYLNCPGFTDTPEEIEALMAFLDRFKISMIQWRNLNFDPMRYLDEMEGAAEHSDPVGMERCLSRIREHAPDVLFGYFNPPRAKWGRSK